MFCDNCGKSNASGILNCAYCGTAMPKITESTGFSDILTFKSSETAGGATSYEHDKVNVGVGKESEAEMKNPDNAIKNNKLGLIAIIISALILFYCVSTNMKTMEEFKSYQMKANEQIDSINEKLTELEGKLNASDSNTEKPGAIVNDGVLTSGFKSLESFCLSVIK